MPDGRPPLRARTHTMRLGRRTYIMAIVNLTNDSFSGDGTGEDIDAAVRRKIASLSRQVPPGSREWDVLYRQYYAEEARKVKPRGA